MRGRWVLSAFLLTGGAVQVKTSEHPPAAPEIVWRAEGQGWGEPAVDDERVYFLDKRHTLAAFDRESGREAWRAATGEHGATTEGTRVVISGEAVIAGDYNVHAFDRRSGRRMWRMEPREGHAPGIHLGDTDGTILLAGSGSGQMHAIDTRRGLVRWSVRLSEAARATVYPPVAAGGLACAGFTEFSPQTRGGVACVAIASGAVAWQRYLPSNGAAPNFGGGLAIDQRFVYAAADDGTIHALSLASGEAAWSVVRPSAGYDVDLKDFLALTVHEGALFAGSRNGIVAALDLAQRQWRWQFTDGNLGSVTSRIAIVDGRLLVPFFSGRLIAIDSTTGRKLWEVTTPASFWLPAASRGRMFAASAREGFLAYRVP